MSDRQVLGPPLRPISAPTASDADPAASVGEEIGYLDGS